MTKYKLLALDMDGTLLDEDSRISAETLHWIGRAKEAGIVICLSTGRGIGNIRPFAAELQVQGPIVAVNGSEVWATPDRLHERHTLPVDDVMALREVALKHGSWYWAYSVEGIYNRDGWIEHPLSTDWLKFGYYEENERILAAIRAEVEAMNRFEITNSHPCNLELNPPGVSKATGLEQVCKLLGITMDEVVAMGDSLNDAAMIQAAGLGVAMGNAQDAVKEIADLVTLSNAEHGVAHFIKDHLLQEK